MNMLPFAVLITILTMTNSSLNKVSESGTMPCNGDTPLGAYIVPKYDAPGQAVTFFQCPKTAQAPILEVWVSAAKERKGLGYYVLKEEKK